MYKHNLKVYGEDLLNGSTSGVVKAQGNMGGLVVRVFAKADATKVDSTDVTIKSGNDGETFNTTLTVLNVKSSTAVEKDDLLAEAILPWDVEKYVTATAAAGSDGETADTNIVVTLGYLPR